jgi:hypothetical protein
MKYKLGMQVRYKGICEQCRGKVGTLSYIREDYNVVRIYLPTSNCNGKSMGDEVSVHIKDIEIVSIKGKQLEFNFME